MAPRLLPTASPAQLVTRCKHFITSMFVTYRVDELKLPAWWLAQQLSNANHDRVDVLDLRDYLKGECGLEPAYSVQRNRIPVAWDEDNQTVLYLTEGMGRPFTFKAADWLTEEEMAEHGPAFRAAA